MLEQQYRHWGIVWSSKTTQLYLQENTLGGDKGEERPYRFDVTLNKFALLLLQSDKAL